MLSTPAVQSFLSVTVLSDMCRTASTHRWNVYLRAEKYGPAGIPTAARDHVPLTTEARILHSPHDSSLLEQAARWKLGLTICCAGSACCWVGATIAGAGRVIGGGGSGAAPAGSAA